MTAPTVEGGIVLKLVLGNLNDWKMKKEDDLLVIPNPDTEIPNASLDTTRITLYPIVFLSKVEKPYQSIVFPIEGWFSLNGKVSTK
jgi:hypothetical protein